MRHSVEMRIRIPLAVLIGVSGAGGVNNAKLDAARIALLGSRPAISSPFVDNGQSSLQVAQKLSRLIDHSYDPNIVSLGSRRNVSELVSLGVAQPTQPKDDCSGQILTLPDGSKECSTVFGITPIPNPDEQPTKPVEQPTHPVKHPTRIPKKEPSPVATVTKKEVTSSVGVGDWAAIGIIGAIAVSFLSFLTTLSARRLKSKP